MPEARSDPDGSRVRGFARGYPSGPDRHLILFRGNDFFSFRSSIGALACCQRRVLPQRRTESSRHPHLLSVILIPALPCETPEHRELLWRAAAPSRRWRCVVVRAHRIQVNAIEGVHFSPNTFRHREPIKLGHLRRWRDAPSKSNVCQERLRSGGFVGGWRSEEPSATTSNRSERESIQAGPFGGTHLW